MFHAAFLIESNIKDGSTALNDVSKEPEHKELKDNVAFIPIYWQTHPILYLWKGDGERTQLWYTASFSFMASTE